MIIEFQIIKTNGETNEKNEEHFSENEDGANLGKLFFTVKYSFEKNALIVTVNKCTNLPAKDTANNTRWCHTFS